jgi:hypothetical protein
LDALLPTIRATQDPVARDLYVTTVAHAAGIRRETLEEEVAGKIDKHPQTTAPLPGAAQVGPATPVEKAILQVMLSSDEWKTRVLAEIDRENFTSEIYRDVFDSLAENSPERLDGISARVLEELQAHGPGVASPDDLFVWALNTIEADRKSREIWRVQREIDLAPEPDKVRLTLEKRALTDERNARRPTWKILEQARRKGAPGS